LGDLEIVILPTSKTDAIDWITKYFILSSAIFVFGEFFRIEQKARVLISRATQIKTQEFLRMQAPTEITRVEYMQTAIIFMDQIANLGVVNLQSFSCFEDMQFG